MDVNRAIDHAERAQLFITRPLRYGYVLITSCERMASHLDLDMQPNHTSCTLYTEWCLLTEQLAYELGSATGWGLHMNLTYDIFDFL